MRVFRLGEWYAVQAAFGLAKIDAKEFWKFLKNYASTAISYGDTNHILVLDALRTSWLHDSGKASMSRPG